MWKSFISIIVFWVVIISVTALTGCAKYTDNEIRSKPNSYNQGTDIWHKSYSGRGPGGNGIK